MAVTHRTARAGEFVVAPRFDLCLDYANTVAWRGSTPEESLHNLPEILDWCVAAGALPEAAATEFRRLPRSNPRLAEQLFRAAIAIREALYRSFYSTASGVAPAEGDLRQLNEGLKRAPTRAAVERAGPGFAWRVERFRPSAAALLAPVLWSAADLLVGPNLTRVRHCANDRCLWLFLDGSKNGTRRWCSMQSCGNRAKAHRHYLRHKRK